MKKYMNEINKIRPWFGLFTYIFMLVTAIFNIDYIYAFVLKTLEIVSPLLFGLLMVYLVKISMSYFNKQLTFSKSYKSMLNVLIYVLVFGVVVLVMVFIFPEIMHIFVTMYNNLVHHLNEALNNLKPLFQHFNFDTKMLKEVNIKKFINDLKTNYRNIFNHLSYYKTIAKVLIIDILLLSNKYFIRVLVALIMGTYSLFYKEKILRYIKILIKALRLNRVIDDGMNNIYAMSYV